MLTTLSLFKVFYDAVGRSKNESLDVKVLVDQLTVLKAISLERMLPLLGFCGGSCFCSNTLYKVTAHEYSAYMQTVLFLLGNYKPPSQNDLSFINELNLALNFFSPIYENFVLLGDFNMSTENPNLKNFMCSFDLESLIDSPTCYKSINPTCIDLILTNKKNHFMKSATFETGLSDHHKLTTTILRKTISKGNSKKMFYRDYKRFDQKKKLKLS